jgi:hypothetical protein
LRALASGDEVSVCPSLDIRYEGERG